MYVDKLVCKETLREWSPFVLPIKVGKSIKMSKGDINIKIGDEDLNLHDKAHAGIEQWTTVVYDFPIYQLRNTGNITKALNINLLGRSIRCHFYTKVQRPQNEIRRGITAICRLQKNEVRDDIFELFVENAAALSNRVSGGSLTRVCESRGSASS
jgi:hypothetical protein